MYTFIDILVAEYIQERLLLNVSGNKGCYERFTSGPESQDVGSGYDIHVYDPALSDIRYSHEAIVACFTRHEQRGRTDNVEEFRWDVAIAVSFLRRAKSDIFRQIIRGD